MEQTWNAGVSAERCFIDLFAMSSITNMETLSNIYSYPIQMVASAKLDVRETTEKLNLEICEAVM